MYISWIYKQDIVIIPIMDKLITCKSNFPTKGLAHMFLYVLEASQFLKHIVKYVIIIYWII